MRAPGNTSARFGALLLLTSIALAACETASSGLGPPAPVTSPVPPQGTAGTLDFGTWNLEWFGDRSEGPGNDALQLENVRHIIAGLEMDLWSVQEVTSGAHFSDLLSRLSGYDGFLADAPFVTDGAAYYSDFGGSEMKVGILYRTATIAVHSARVILKEHESDFAGRPPVEVSLTASVGGSTVGLVMILLHAKAGAQTADWERRLAGSRALKTYLDATHPTTRVMVIGDFNDDVDVSITRPNDSPYRNFVDDGSAYVVPSAVLSEAGVSSTVSYSDMIDHHLATTELMAAYQAGSAQVFRADQYVSDYSRTTSDHYPVLSRFGVGSTRSAVGAQSRPARPARAR